MKHKDGGAAAAMESAITESGARSTAPSFLVTKGKISFGSWNGIPGSANLLDAERPYHYPIPRFIQRLRLKEWRAIQAGDEDCFLCCVLYDAKFISMVSLDIWERKKGQKRGFRKMFLGSRFGLPSSLGSGATKVDSGGIHLEISLDSEGRRLSLKAGSSSAGNPGEAIALDLNFDFSHGGASPFSVCLPFASNRAMYSTKVLMPASGTLSAGDLAHSFIPSTASAILDDHKGYYPYRLHYDWVTGFGFDRGGRRIGFNLTDNQVGDQARYNENRLWIGRDIYPLAPVKITRPFGRESPWNIQDTEGTVDLVFTPEVSHDIALNLGIAEIDYAGPFGRFEGRLRSPSGELVNVSGLYGMGEDKNVRL
ncbi:MAG: DUF2804 domain-containing protein [Spirochaetes bacterium]|nr:DUF2804 domain-containing protein [Spirochaetota bacterium]